MVFILEITDHSLLFRRDDSWIGEKNLLEIFPTLKLGVNTRVARSTCYVCVQFWQLAYRANVHIVGLPSC
ncbi:hypothetical protein C5167_016202 [Papaver somniferum]|nr:hypothetical protein C5167_016202 [Papaver somniferum]